MRVLRVAAMIALVAWPAYAQNAVQRYGEKDKEKTTSQREQEKEDERAYKRSLGNVPEKGPVDPWGNARAVETPKSSAKTDAKATSAKPRAKSGSTTN